MSPCFVFLKILLYISLMFWSIDNRKISKNCLKCDKTHSFSFFWKINQTHLSSPPSYFFGTIHAPYTKVWDYIPKNAKHAFKNSQQIIFELDLMNFDTLLSLTKCQLLPPGIKLMDVIPIDIYYRLQRHLKFIRFKIPLWITDEQKSRGLFADTLYTSLTLHWERKRPIWVMIMLNSLTENDIKSKGISVLDSFLYKKASKLHKKIGSVENAQEQCVTLNRLNTTQVLYALNQTLLQHENIRRGSRRISNHTTDEMIRHYNCGNLNEALFSEESLPVLKNHSNSRPEELEIARTIENYFRSEIILKRNKRMTSRVLELLALRPNESFFFVFGAGKDSIIELMKDSGLEIHHINDTQPRNSLICNNNNNHLKSSSLETSFINNEDPTDQTPSPSPISTSIIRSLGVDTSRTRYSYATGFQLPYPNIEIRQFKSSVIIDDPRPMMPIFPQYSQNLTLSNNHQYTIDESTVHRYPVRFFQQKQQQQQQYFPVHYHHHHRHSQHHYLNPPTSFQNSLQPQSFILTKTAGEENPEISSLTDRHRLPSSSFNTGNREQHYHQPDQSYEKQAGLLGFLYYRHQQPKYLGSLPPSPFFHISSVSHSIFKDFDQFWILVLGFLVSFFYPFYL